MKLKDYHELAMRTAKQMNNKMDQLVHGGMGAASEPGELALTALAFLEARGLDRANVLEELGDGMWFAAYCTDTIGMTLPELEPLTYTSVLALGSDVPLVGFAVATLRFCHLGGEIATQIKAHAFYGKALDKPKLSDTLKAYVESIVAVGALVGYELAPILEFNIAKLSARYPTKYSDEAALVRADKVAESCQDGECKHDSDCAVHNAGVPELLGPCDCSLSKTTEFINQ